MESCELSSLMKACYGLMNLRCDGRMFGTEIRPSPVQRLHNFESNVMKKMHVVAGKCKTCSCKGRK